MNLIITGSLRTVCYENPVILYAGAARTVLSFNTILFPSALFQPNSDVPPCSLVHRQQRAVTTLVTPHILDSRRYISWFTSPTITNFLVRSYFFDGSSILSHSERPATITKSLHSVCLWFSFIAQHCHWSHDTIRFR
jgi:hypothetical protein